MNTQLALFPLLEKLIIVMKRFPLAIVCCVMLCIDMLNLWPKLDAKLIFLSGGFWFTSFKLYIESREWSLTRYYLIGCSVFLLMSCYLHSLSLFSYVQVFLTFGLFLSIFIAPFLKQNVTNAHIWKFNRDLWLHIFLTVFTSIAVVLLLAFVLFTLRSLFDICFYSTIYLDMFIIIATLFSPAMLLSGIPNRYNVVQNQYPRAVVFFITYLLLPFLIAYTIILYAYMIKILIAWDLPKGGVAYLISAFGSIGMLTYLASSGLDTQSKWIELFKNYFFKLMCIPVILFGISIGTRIYEFGLTDKRYCVLLCGIWFLASTLFVLIKKHEKSSQFILASAVFLLIGTSFGPWNVEQLSIWSQTQKLEHVLKKNNLLMDGKIHRLQHSLSEKEVKHIRSIVDYLVRRKATDCFKQWFDNPPTTTRGIIENLGISSKLK